jgi:hypothetical protein
MNIPRAGARERHRECKKREKKEKEAQIGRKWKRGRERKLPTTLCHIIDLFHLAPQ